MANTRPLAAGGGTARSACPVTSGPPFLIGVRLLREEPCTGATGAPRKSDGGAALCGRAAAPPPGGGPAPRAPGRERRRRWAASGRLPPGLAAKFTHAEQGVLALVAAEVVRRGDCRLAVGHIAAIVGVSETTVRNAIREARKLGLVTVEERPVTGFRNLPNIVRIVSAEWTAWLRLARKSSIPQGGGCKSPQRTPTQVPDLGESRKPGPSKGCRQAAGDLDRSGQSRIRAVGRTGRAMP